MPITVPSAVASNTRQGAGPIVVTLTLTAGETGWIFFTDEEGSAAAITGITGGGTWTKRAEHYRTSAARFHAELWTTNAGVLTGASSVSIAYSGSPNQVIAFAGSYPGVSGIGATGVAAATSTNPTVSLTTTGNNSWSVSGLATWDGTAPTAPALTGTFRDSDQATGASDISGNMIDNTRATPGSLACAMTEVSTEWIGLAVEFLAPQGPTPATGVLTAAGFAAAVVVTLNKFVQVGLAALQLASFSPALDVGIRINDVLLGAGYSPTPNDVVLSNNLIPGGSGDSGAVALSPLTGQINVTGFAPVIADPRVVLPSLGQLVATGQAPTASVSNNKVIPISLGQLTVTGIAPSASVSNNISVPIGLGALTATGLSPTVQTPKNVPIGLGSVTATGQAPTVLTPRVVPVGLGALTATGFSPVPNIGVNLSLGTGQVTATGLAPVATATNNKQLLPGTGAVAVTGIAPVVTASDKKTALPGTGQVIATGQAPTVVLPQRALPGLGQVTVTGFAPSASIGTGLDIKPFPGQLIVTGYAPSLLAFTFQVTGGPVMAATITAGGVLSARVTGGRVLTETITGGPV